MAVRHTRQRRQDLANPLGKGRSPHDTIGNICPQFQTGLHHLLPAHSQTKQSVHSKNHCRPICTASGHPCSYRYMFFQLYGHTLIQVIRINQQLCSLIYNIIFIHREKGQICTYPDSRFCIDSDTDLIIKIHRLHHHLNLMITIGPTPDHIQAQINFSHCF